ncbi:TrmB family transcriptional regulator [Nitrosopumilus sp.]|uniref:TrmB family transcriptional regulator n=1 Tax=Nitrosopumilus sp. TaxID=2024843 RepID=UPI00261F2E40|nr:helix-turn-helix domain-containing protein [Nitrosopumilus sp.]
MLSKDEVCESLVHFGLEEIDAKIYVGLLQMGSVTVGTMAQKLDVDRGKAYRSLNKLRNMGVISTTFSNPTIVNAVKPAEALTSIIQKKEDEIVMLQKLAHSLVENLNNFERESAPTDLSSFSIVQGRSNIYTRIGKLIQESTEKIFLVTTSDDLMRMYHTSIPDKIHARINAGGEVRIITEECTAKAMEIIEQLGTPDIKIGKLPSKSRMIVESKNQLIMSGAMKESMDLNDDVDSIMYTNSAEMVENMFSLCTHLWKKSKPLKTLSTQ